MKIDEFIQTQILLPFLHQTGVLVVYDPERRYHELCLELASDTLHVVDASESSIISRAAALPGLQILGEKQPPITELLIYVPAQAPLDDDQRQRDPFAVYRDQQEQCSEPRCAARRESSAANLLRCKWTKSS